MMPASSLKRGRASLSRDTAIAFADCALHNLARRYPYAMQHLRRSRADSAPPHQCHPVFFGSYDWHSSVHMHWSLIRLLQQDPTLPQRTAIHRLFASRFTAVNASVEYSYLQHNPGFERTYGWAWLLQLHSELLQYAGQHKPALAWANHILPIVTLVRQRWCEFLPLSHYPQRAGTHANSAFAMTLAIGYARRQRDVVLLRALTTAARRWFKHDQHYPAGYEPGGSDFLSAGLCEAVLMSDICGPTFPAWWQAFEPERDALKSWLKPVVVGSRTDGQLVHLDGLNLSRAWCLRALATRLPHLQVAFDAAAERHLKAALPHVVGGDFVATHWLVSFALLALTEKPPSG